MKHGIHCRLFQFLCTLATICALDLTWAGTSMAGDFWSYELQDPPPAHEQHGSSFGRTESHHLWAVIQFDKYPYPGQLRDLPNWTNAERVTLVFYRPVVPSLAKDYLELAQTWQKKGVQSEFRFIRSLPSQSEAEALKPLCGTGARISYFTNVLPSANEAQNLQLLKGCVDVKFIFNRYFLSRDRANLLPLENLPLGLVNNYYPSHIQADVLNRLNNPVSLTITDFFPSTKQIEILNEIKSMSSLLMGITQPPSQRQYEEFRNLKRDGVRLGFQWLYSTLRPMDLEAWAALRLHQIQIPQWILQNADYAKKLREMDGEVILETFPISKIELYPSF